MTLENMSRCGFPGDRNRFPAIGLHIRATGVKFATARDVQQAGDFAGEIEAIALRIRVRIGVGRQQRLGIRMSRVPEDVL